MSSHLSHDTAARLLDLTPAELTGLVNKGVIPRVDKNAYALAPIVHTYIGWLRDEQARANLRPTQAEIAAHLDLSERRLRELLTEFGLDHKQVPLAEIRIRYIRKLREEAAGRAGSGELNLTDERALLAREQRKGQEIKNNVALGTYAAIELLTDILSSAAQAVVDRLDQIPAALRRVAPDMPQAVRDTIMGEIASARNEMARKTESILADHLDPTDIQEDAPLEGLPEE